MIFKNDLCFLKSLAGEQWNKKFFSTFFLFQAFRSRGVKKNDPREQWNKLRLSRLLRSKKVVPVPGPSGHRNGKGPTSTTNASRNKTRAWQRWSYSSFSIELGFRGFYGRSSMFSVVNIGTVDLSSISSQVIDWASHDIKINVDRVNDASFSFPCFAIDSSLTIYDKRRLSQPGMMDGLLFISLVMSGNE